MRSYFSVVQSSFNLINGFEKKYLWTFVILTVTINLLSLSRLFILQFLFNRIQMKAGVVTEYLVLISVYVLSEVIEKICDAWFAYYGTKIRLNFKVYVDKLILNHGETLSLSSFEKSETFDIIQRTQNLNSDDILDFCQEHIKMISTIINIVSYLYVIIRVSYGLLPLVLIIPVIQFVVNNIINEKQYSILRKRTDKTRESWYYKFLLLSGTYFKEIKLFNYYKKLKEKHINLEHYFKRQDLKIAKESATKNGLLSILNSIILGAVFVFTILKGFEGDVLLGDVIIFIRSVNSLQLQITTILSTGTEILKKRLYFEQFLEFFKIEVFSWQSEFNEHISSIEEIEVKNLSFKYPKTERNIIKNVSLKLKSGNLYALVGPNGSGKTTFIKLLLGLYKDYEGKIIINGSDLLKVDKSSFLECSSVLFQDFLKVEGTLEENIKLNSQNETSLNTYLSEFNLNEFSYGNEQFQLGYWFDSGQQLSAGEWQRVALARVFYRDATFRILDEPNSNLDALSNERMLDSLRNRIPDTINIIILHNTELFKKYIDYYLKFSKDGSIEVIKNEEKL